MDPWKHRSSKMNCATCMWNVAKERFSLACEEKEIESGQTVRPIPPQIGRCRRHAPTMNGYPVVLEMDWCGDHKLDENKV